MLSNRRTLLQVCINLHPQSQTPTTSMLTATDLYFTHGPTSQTQALCQTHLPKHLHHTHTRTLTDTPRDTYRHNHSHHRHTCSLCLFLHHMNTEAYHGHIHGTSYSLKHITTNSHRPQTQAYMCSHISTRNIIRHIHTHRYTCQRQITETFIQAHFQMLRHPVHTHTHTPLRSSLPLPLPPSTTTPIPLHHTPQKISKIQTSLKKKPKRHYSTKPIQTTSVLWLTVLGFGIRRGSQV